MLQEFSYLSPATRDELLTLRQERGSRCRLLAGGTDVLVDIRGGKVSPSCVLDVKRVEKYHAISYDEKEGLSIGAAVTCKDIIISRKVNTHHPMLSEVASHLGSPQLRNRATVVGNICTASPCADMATILLALEASVELASKERGTRRLPISEFFTGVKKTACAIDEVVERVIIPPHMAGAEGGYEKLKRIKGHDLALVSVLMIKKGEMVRVAIGSCAETPVLLKDFSHLTPVEEIVKEAERSIIPIDDIRASRDFRLFMVKTYIERLMTALVHTH